MVRNGRSSCGGPAIQQTPRKGGFREMFRASEGRLILSVDYDFIELCTLASVCEARYGYSNLAEVIRKVKYLDSIVSVPGLLCGGLTVVFTG